MNIFFHIYTGNISTIIIILLLSFSLVYLFYKLTNKFKFQKYLFGIGLLVYIGIIIYETILNRETSGEIVGFSLIPFETYKKAATVNVEYYREAFMNVAVFVPLGFLYGCLDIEFFKEKRWLIILGSCLFSIVIEVIQYVFKLGFAEIDDVIHNTLGATIGILLFLIFDVFINWILKLIKQNK